MIIFVTKLVECQSADNNAILTFEVKNGARQKVAINKEVREGLLRELQIISARQNAELLTLTLSGISTAASAEGKALILQTRELGAIAVSVDDRAISGLQRNLAELSALPTSNESRN